METKEYTSNINCNACVNKVAPHFNDAEGVEFWAVDLEHPDRILTVEGSVSAEQVQALAQAAGYTLAPR